MTIIQLEEFSRVLGGDVKPYFINEYHRFPHNSAISANNLSIDELAEKTCPQGWNLETYKKIMTNVYAVVKDQVSGEGDLLRFIRKILPVYIEISEQFTSINDYYFGTIRVI